MIMLDTNVLSEIMRPVPDPTMMSWLDPIDRSEAWTTSITVYELEFGVFKLDPGRKRDERRSEVDRVLRLFAHRIMPLEQRGAAVAAELFHERRRVGRTVDLRDTLIAGIAIATRATLATRNVRHFADLPELLPHLAIDVVNPWGPDDPGPDA